MGWTYLTQEEAQRTIEPNTLTKSFTCLMFLFDSWQDYLLMT
jgi:hypothetical protein